jgi:hypothetical protein
MPDGMITFFEIVGALIVLVIWSVTVYSWGYAEGKIAEKERKP